MKNIVIGGAWPYANGSLHIRKRPGPVHQLDLFIPEDAIYGDVGAFFDIYDEYISDTLKQKYKTFKTLNEGYSIIQSEIPEGLMRKFIYVKTKGDQQVVSNSAIAGFISEIVK